jgi:Gram-negative bacterial TonB protein C-terminal
LILLVAGYGLAQPPSPVRRVTPPPRPQSVRVNQADQEERLNHRVDPVFPKAHIQGTVRFRAVIGENGRVEKLALISGHPFLVVPARDAVMQWEYLPKLWGGEPIKVQTTIDVPFFQDGGVIEPKGNFH